MATESDKGLARAHVTATDAQLKALARDIERVYQRALQRIAEGVSRPGDELERLSTILPTIDILRESGFEDVLTSVEDLYLEQARQVRASLESASGRDIPLSSADIDLVQELVDLEIENAASTLESLTGSARSVIAQQVLSGEVDIASDIALEALARPRIISDIETEISTNTRAFSRGLTIKKSRELGVEKYEYFGQNDQKTRDFCRGLLDDGPIYTLEQIAKLDNKQGLDVLTYGGGYNCRHTWLPVFE